ncbi:MAG: hypothetical protein WCJ09_10690, partial [Planctomycetota bacterium]
KIEASTTLVKQESYCLQQTCDQMRPVARGLPQLVPGWPENSRTATLSGHAVLMIESCGINPEVAVRS